MSERHQLPQFTIDYEGDPPSELIIGFASIGLAGLTAIDYLVDHLGWSERGFVGVRGMPSITPFENGRPRHHTRLFTADGPGPVAMLSEILIPSSASLSFAEEVVDWATAQQVDDIVIIAGIPIPHGPDEHRTFYIATSDEMADRFTSAGIKPMPGGFLDGVKAEILELSIETGLHSGVLVTPVHHQFPDVTAALQLLEAIGSLYDFDIDLKPLQTFAQQEQRYFDELTETIEAAQTWEHPADRMYM